MQDWALPTGLACAGLFSLVDENVLSMSPVDEIQSTYILINSIRLRLT